MSDLSWQLRDRLVSPADMPLVMGILNVTPDSFSDGGTFAGADEAVAWGLELVRQGADLLDVGGESTRPGSDPVPLEEELRRVVPVVRRLAEATSVPISVDTTKAAVARAALEAGAHAVNDVSALRGDPEMAGVVRAFGAGVVLMHMQGTPATMQQDPRYDDVVGEVTAFLQARLQAATDLGIAGRQVVLDPGIGFGKTGEHNLALLANLGRLQALGRPVCLGVSRKRFLGQLLGRGVDERLAGSLAAACFGMAAGAHVLRVHDVAQTRDGVVVFRALRERRGPGNVVSPVFAGPGSSSTAETKRGGKPSNTPTSTRTPDGGGP
jgi:dihydropteroate synthase